jgi:hypothetical protein
MHEARRAAPAMAGKGSDMATYYHYYRCGCVHWERNQWVTERSEDEFPRYHHQQHFSFDNTAKCNRYLRFARTEKAVAAQANRTGLAIEDPGYGVALVMRDAKSKSGPTIAVMWEPETGRWYHGSCRHGLDRAEAPPGFSARVDKLETDPADWAFGWNCAEVECVVKAYKSGRKAADLKGCYFIAYSVATPRGLYGACRTCRTWIADLGAKSYSPNR